MCSLPKVLLPVFQKELQEQARLLVPDLRVHKVELDTRVLSIDQGFSAKYPYQRGGLPGATALCAYNRPAADIIQIEARPGDQ